MQVNNYEEKYCIIGGGAAGITTAKNLREQSIPFDLIEKEDEFGGNWYFGKPSSSIYKSVHMISSREFSEYTDFPADKTLPTYLRADQALDYLRLYARTFDVYRHAEFNRTVVEIVPVPSQECWDVCLDGGETRRYKGVLVANGHLVRPNLPDYPGTFTGLQLHSAQYKTPDILRGKRVLVVGAGNSGCDIAVEAVHHGEKVFHSTRRGYYYWPKFVSGKPVDAWAERFLEWRTPLWLRRLYGGYILRRQTAGQPEQYGLPKPDHKMFEAHFIINSTLLYHLGHGDIVSKGDVKAFDGTKVLFKDGSQEEIDVIVHATGFELSFPFLDQKHLSWKKEKPDLFLNLFDPSHKNLFFIGLFQTSTGNWPLMDYQAQLVARYLGARVDAPARAVELERQIAQIRADMDGGIRYMTVQRHSIEVEHFVYRQMLRRLIKKIGSGQRAMTAPPRISPPAIARTS
ncbi:flavin-containing monooxygenase [Labrys sp. KB_33_2]|uniref:flavin-containing monooxygenase n=1 Tax=Labrys sp. KB_33_2 TaxID=3237479 RepID=UPI003F8E4556